MSHAIRESYWHKLTGSNLLYIELYVLASARGVASSVERD